MFRAVAVIEECALVGGLAMQVKEIAWVHGARTKIHAFTLKYAFIHCYGATTTSSTRMAFRSTK
jgi:hypothetical protein